MIETFASLAFVVAIVLMCGPQACYNAGSWIGLILKVFWKVAAWAYRAIATKVSRNKEVTPIAQISAATVIYAQDTFRNESSKEEEKFEGVVIEGKANVL